MPQGDLASVGMPEPQNVFNYMTNPYRLFLPAMPPKTVRGIVTKLQMRHIITIVPNGSAAVDCIERHPKKRDTYSGRKPDENVRSTLKLLPISAGPRHLFTKHASQKVVDTGYYSI